MITKFRLVQCVAGVVAVSGLIAFQNCSSPSQFENASTSTAASIAAGSDVAPTPTIKAPSASLRQVSNSRQLFLTWSNVGSDACIVQYEIAPNSNQWRNVGNPIPNCKTPQTNVSFYLPNDGWVSQNWNGLRLQLASSSGASLAVFDAPLRCNVLPGSSVSTPQIDEDCNGQWDNARSAPGNSQTISKPAIAAGSLSACPLNSNGIPLALVTFYKKAYMKGDDSVCTNVSVGDLDSHTAIIHGQNGVAPATFFIGNEAPIAISSTACFLTYGWSYNRWVSPNNIWDSYSCFYLSQASASQYF